MVITVIVICMSAILAVTKFLTGLSQIESTAHYDSERDNEEVCACCVWVCLCERCVWVFLCVPAVCGCVCVRDVCGCSCVCLLCVGVFV